jgi:hypothetical protein
MRGLNKLHKLRDTFPQTRQRFNLSLSRRHDAQEVCIQGSDALVRSWEK